MLILLFANDKAAIIILRSLFLHFTHGAVSYVSYIPNTIP